MNESCCDAVRRLLLLPLVLLASCASGSGDIVVTSNVGEKTIIKRETIAPHDQGVDEEFNNSMINSAERSIELYKDLDRGTGRYKEEIEEKRKEIDALKLDLEIGEWYKQFSYIPIYEDLNGKKTVGEEKYTQCVARGLTSAQIGMLSGYIVFEAILSKGEGSRVVDEIQRQICAEFAVWG